MTEEELDLDDWFYQLTQSHQSRGYTFTEHFDCYSAAGIEIINFLQEMEPRKMVVCCLNQRTVNLIEANVRISSSHKKVGNYFVNDLNNRTVQLFFSGERIIRGIGEIDTLVMVTEGMPQLWPWIYLVPVLRRAPDPQLVNIHYSSLPPTPLPDLVETPSARYPREKYR